MTNELTEIELRLTRDIEILARTQVSLMSDVRNILSLCDAYRKEIERLTTLQSQKESNIVEP